MQIKLGARTKAIAAAAQRKSWSCLVVETKQGAALDFGIADMLECEHVVCGLRALIGDSSTRADYLWRRTELVVGEGEGAPRTVLGRGKCAATVAVLSPGNRRWRSPSGLFPG